MRIKTMQKTLGLLLGGILLLTPLAACQSAEETPVSGPSRSTGETNGAASGEGTDPAASGEETGGNETAATEPGGSTQEGSAARPSGGQTPGITQGGKNSQNNAQKTTATTGGKQTNPVTPGKTTSLTRDQVMAAMPASVKNTTLKFFCWSDLKTSTYGDAIREFEKKSGIRFETEICTKDQFSSQLAGKISSGSSPDMCLSFDNSTSYMKNLVSIDKSGFNFNDTAWDKALMDSFTFGGRTYAMNIQDSPNKNMGVIYYNKKALRKAEMTDKDPYKIWEKNEKDWTWAKLWSMCEEFLKANRNRDGYYGMNLPSSRLYANCFDASFFNYDAQKGQWVNLMKSSVTAKRYEELVDKVNKKYCTEADNGTAFTQGQTLFQFGFSSTMERDQTVGAALGDNLGIVPVPSDSTHMPLYEYYAFSIPIGAKNAAAVPYFVRYVCDPKTYDLSTFYKTPEARKAIEASMKRGNFCYGQGWKWNIWNEMVKGTSSQVRSILDAHSGEIEDMVFEQNETIKTLEK